MLLSLPIIGGTINRMQVTYDQAKNDRNITDRQLPFGLASRFDFETAKLWQDTRREYPEDRWVAIGYLDSRLHVLVFMPHSARNPHHQLSQSQP